MQTKNKLSHTLMSCDFGKTLKLFVVTSAYFLNLEKTKRKYN